MKKLNYMRVEYDKDGNQTNKSPKIVTRVNKEPAMPADVQQVADGVWQRVTHGQVSTVIRTWWLTDAARMVA